MYQPKHFKLYELVSQDFFDINIDRGVNVWFVFDFRLLWTIDALREKWGPMVANTWYWDGSNEYRGYRDKHCPIGADLSQHKFGRAVDLIPLQAPVDEIRKDIIDKPYHPSYQHITCIEDKVSWLHIDCRNWDKRSDNILIINP
jgi:hypothetical protein